MWSRAVLWLARIRLDSLDTTLSLWGAIEQVETCVVGSELTQCLSAGFDSYRSSLCLETEFEACRYESNEPEVLFESTNTSVVV